MAIVHLSALGVAGCGRGGDGSQLNDGTPTLRVANTELGDILIDVFTGDNAPGATNGQGVTAFGARWFVVPPPATR